MSTKRSFKALACVLAGVLVYNVAVTTTERRVQREADERAFVEALHRLEGAKKTARRHRMFDVKDGVIFQMDAQALSDTVEMVFAHVDSATRVAVVERCEESEANKIIDETVRTR